MKSRSTLYLFIGVALILFNILVFLFEPNNVKQAPKDVAYNIGYYFGAYFLALIGLVFLLAAWRLHRKI
ncbi:MAG: hypothetical protein WCG67_05165 [Ferruginibacter sp.]